jgi:L-asparaginase/Glu-tRNA(Gln) amidotransferase subunit D
MTDPLIEALQDFLNRNGRPMQVLFLNTGGTFSCLPNAEGLLEPIDNEAQLKELIFDGVNLGHFVNKKILKLRLRHLMNIDSSQIEEIHRDNMVAALHPEYSHIDGVIVLHGTDTCADTAKFIHLALPYYDPRQLIKNEEISFNWTKPVLILSSQVPAVDSVDGKLSYRIDSDGPMNLSVALMMIADEKIGEAGIITNNGDALRGTSTEKGAEVDIPPFRTDPGVPPLAKYTALGLRYLPQGFLQKGTEGNFVPFVIKDSSKFEDKVITVFESSHLNLLKAFLESTGAVREKFKEKAPKIIIYVSKGAGNVKEEDYKILKEAEAEGIITFRVPLPGGRIPTHQIYDVPGHELEALNMQPQTAKYKAMMTLKLAEDAKTKTRKEFISKMMTTTWSNEFLPRR